MFVTVSHSRAKVKYKGSGVETQLADDNLDNKNTNGPSERGLGAVFLVVGWIVTIALVAMLMNSTIFGTKKPMISETQAGTSITLYRDQDSHFRIKGSINGVQATFLIDTGATSVAVSSEIAKRANLKREAEMGTETANGSSVGYFTVIDKMNIGTVELNHVNAIIVPNMGMDEALLGMNVLQHFKIDQTKDTMTITVPPQQQ